MSSKTAFAFVPNLRAVQERLDAPERYEVGISAMATCPDGERRWVDLAQLDELSLARWMRSGNNGNKNPRAERLVLYLLGWRSDPV